MDTGDTPIVTMTDLFRFDQPENAKVKLNRHPGPDSTPAWDLLAGDADGWFGMNTYRGKKKDSNNNMGGREYLFTFAQYYPYGAQYYIFGGLYRMTEIRPAVYETCGYRMEHDDRYAGYEKRLIIRIDHSLSEKEIYLRLYDRIQNQLHPEVYEISPHVKTETFEGYDRVNLTYQTLHRIVACDDPEWKAALSRIKAVYVLTDLSNGRLYVGSAYGDANGLWGRWASYADDDDPTGGNAELRRLAERRGAGHIAGNFTYSILEIFDPKTADEVVPDRESYWKKVLDTLRHGYNGN